MNIETRESPRTTTTATTAKGVLADIDETNFDQEVLASPETFLVDFSAVWCGPCKLLTPILADLAAEESGTKFGKVDIDDSPAIATRYGIRSAPTVLVFKGGQVVARHVGLTTKERLRALLLAK